jgi:hypothetical protein
LLVPAQPSRRHCPDRAQPGYRRSADPHRARRAILLNVLSLATRSIRRPGAAAPEGLHRGPRQDRQNGARIGLPSDPTDPASDVYCSKLSLRSQAAPQSRPRQANPSVQVPAAGLNGKGTPNYPLGGTFIGRAWSEPTRLRLAYAFEPRRPPPGCLSPAAIRACRAGPEGGGTLRSPPVLVRVTVLVATEAAITATRTAFDRGGEWSAAMHRTGAGLRAHDHRKAEVSGPLRRVS